MLQRRSSVVLMALLIMALLGVALSSAAPAATDTSDVGPIRHVLAEPFLTLPSPTPDVTPQVFEIPLTPDAIAPASASAFVKLSLANSPYVSAIVTLNDAPLATYEGDLPGLAATSPRITGRPLDLAAPASIAYRAYLNQQLDALIAALSADIPDLRVSHRFDIVIGGLAVQVPRQDLERLAQPALVAGVLADEPLAITNDPSPGGELPVLWEQWRAQGQSGTGVTIGILDSGITPETPALADPAQPAPPGWPCDFSSGANPGPPAACSGRLISAQRFLSTYEAVASLQPDEYTSARDERGHGTTIATLAAGNPAGVATQAQIAAYKVCGTRGCFPSDIAAAIQQTVTDQITVLSLALGGANPAHSRIIERAVFDAYSARTFVIAAGIDADSPASPSSLRAAGAAYTAGAAALLTNLYPERTPAQLMATLINTAALSAPDQDHELILGDPDQLIPEPPASGPSRTAVEVPRMPGIVSVARALIDTSGRTRGWSLSVSYPADQPRDFAIAVPGALVTEPFASQSFTITIDGRDVPLGQARNASILISSDETLGQIELPVNFVRAQGDLDTEQTCTPATLPLEATLTCTLVLTNRSGRTADIALVSQLPRQLSLNPESIVGGRLINNFRVGFSGELLASNVTGINARVAVGASPFGYLPLSLFAGSRVLALSDESLVNLTLTQGTINLADQRYTSLAVVSNGYLMLGGGSAADISALNRRLPNPDQPNNVLAPFWTDLDPSAGGRVLANTICTSGPACWFVVEFERVPNASTPAATNTFQVWLGLDRPDDISFVYGPELSLGDRGLLSVGVENANGTSGATLYFDGAGNPPTPTLPNGVSTYEVDISTTPGQPITHTLTFQANAREIGPFSIYSFILSDVVEGITITRSVGEVEAQ